MFQQGQIIDYSWTKYKTHKKHLKIKGVSKADAGILHCKGTWIFAGVKTKAQLRGEGWRPIHQDADFGRRLLFLLYSYCLKKHELSWKKVVRGSINLQLSVSEWVNERGKRWLIEILRIEEMFPLLILTALYTLDNAKKIYYESVTFWKGNILNRISFVHSLRHKQIFQVSLKFYICN